MKLIDADHLRRWILSRMFKTQLSVADVIDQIDREDTIEPEQKKGEWIPAFDGKFTGGAYWFSCSKCKRIVPEVRNGGWNFCPQCGADMRGEEDE